MRSILVGFVCTSFVATAACGGKHTGNGDDDDDGGPDACVGLQCQVVDCNAMGLPPTTVSGTVYAPNGTLPLFGIDVYVPNSDPGPFVDGVACGNCSASLPGNPVVSVRTDEAGKFTLTNLPAGENVPLVITTGKWRRQITLPHVEKCTDTPLAAADTRLPKNKSEGDIPQIAVTTGSADSLECLIRRLGIEDSEITTDAKPGRVHLYHGNGVSGFSTGNEAFSDAQQLWGNLDAMKKYDIVIFSCEGGQNPQTKPQSALDAVKAYADIGGRVFLSHWHNIWIGGAFQSGGDPRPQVWDTIATWQSENDPGNNTVDTIDEVNNSKGVSFATWMLNVMGSTTRDLIPIKNGTAKITSQTVDSTKAESWVTLTPQNHAQVVQNFQFSTPNEAPIEARCGKVVFSDMHVSGDGGSGNNYPGSCGGSNDLLPQEKALAFMFFDISSCVGQIF